MLLFNHCKEEPVQPPTQEKTSLSKGVTNFQNDSEKVSALVIVDSAKTKDKIKGGGGSIVPLAPVCGILDRYIWEFDHYQANSGKRVGILPKEDIFINYPTIVRMFKDTLGYNYVNCSSGYVPVARQQTYADGNIMVGGLVLTNIPGANSVALTYPGLYAYYFDEPVGGDIPYIVSCSQAGPLLQQFRLTLNSNGSSSSKLIVGDVTPSEATCSAVADQLMCTRYFNDVLHLWPDQRPLWTWFESSFQTKFDDTWISATSDIGEYDQLLGHAANLGLNGVWFYQREDVALQNGAMNRIKEFSFYAWKWGFLTRVEREYVYTYECEKPNPCDCDRSNINDGWVLVSKRATPGYRNRAYY